MKKKVCLIHKVNCLDPRSFFKEGRSLQKAGYDTSIMSFYDEQDSAEGIRLISFQPPRRRLIRFFMTNYMIFKKALKEKSDVYHFHDLDFIPWAILLKLLTSGKVIYDCHEAYPEYMLIKTYIPKQMRKTVSIMVEILESIGSFFFDSVVANDNFVYETFNNKNKEVIYNFPLADFFTFKHDDLPYEKRPYDIIFIGSLPVIHCLPMLEAAEILREQGYHPKWLLLPLKDSPRDWVIAEVKKRNLEDYFTVPEFVPFSSVPDYLYKSRIGIVTIPPEKKFLKNIPLKIFEYMGCGLPIISSDLPPTRQFVEGKDCALLVEHDPQAYAHAIRSLMDDPLRAKQMGENGKKMIDEEYNWETEEKKLLKLYEVLLGDKN